MTKQITLLTALTFLLGLLWAATPAEATDTVLPPSDWYTITWVQESDTLHWINAAGEQASIPRPELDGQISQAATRLHISPDGRYMAVISPLSNGREGLGFYSFETGSFLQVHQTEPNEIIRPVLQSPFDAQYSYSAFVLSNTVTNRWRIIAFDTQSGNVFSELTWNDDLLPPQLMLNDTYTPSLTQLVFNPQFNSLNVRFQLVPNNNAVIGSYASFVWRIVPEDFPSSVAVDTLNYNPYAGFDVNPIGGQVVHAYFDLQYGTPVAANSANNIRLTHNNTTTTLANVGSAGSARLPRWLNNGQWIGYYGTNGAFQPHWTIMTADAQTSLPINPQISGVHHTPDGFLTRQTGLWQLNHVTSLAYEPFAETIGNTVFAPGQSFAVVYTTPVNVAHELASIADPVLPETPGLLLQATVCPPAPPARLAPGDDARVTYTNGASLNLRYDPAGEFLMQIAEGTPATIIEGPVCADGYLWYRLDLNNGTGGWAAEGDSDDYYLEPYSLELIEQPQIQPTALPDRAIATTLPPRAVPTNPPRAAMPGDGDCSNAPSGSELAAGEYAHTFQDDGTLAMRTELNDELPSYSIPGNRTLTVIDGPVCNGGFRMWKVSLTLNDTPVEGWVADGFASRRYLRPGPARAQ